MIEQFSTSLTFCIRPVQRTDLPKLEWFGMFTQYRNIILQAFERQENAEVVMLVAEINHFPIGQVWIDLSKGSKASTGILWALRVLLPFQRLGIGRRLLISAENLLIERGFAIAEIGVEKDNMDARILYERLGYQIVKENVETWEYLTPDGQQIQETSIEWILHKRLA